MAKRPYCYNTRILYGLAKSKEVGLTDELLHMLVYRETGKSSIKELTPSELAAVCRILQKCFMKIIRNWVCRLTRMKKMTLRMLFLKPIWGMTISRV